MSRNLVPLFSPQSVAVIGASRTPQKVGYIVLKNLQSSGFPGRIYPVNPNAESIEGLNCIKDIASLPEIVDLAIIALPSSLVCDTLSRVGEKGIKNVVVFSAGFKEIGPEGEKLEQSFKDIAQKYSLNVLGPNCLGFVNNACPLNATFGQAARDLGNLRFISQSGAIAASLFDWSSSISLGFDSFITLGNKAVLNENDFLEHYHNQKSQLPPSDKPYPIGLYLESIANGPEFLRLISQISQTDPVFIIKPGKTPAAAKAMQSHTGAIAGADDILDAALTQSGALRCQTLEDFFDLARGFAWENSPTGPKVAIISNAGGPAVISADAVITSGLQLAQFDQATKDKLLEVLPRSASILNPIDVLGDALAQRYAQAAEIILQTNEADSLLVILTPQVMTQVETTAQLIGELSRKYQKPIFCSFIGGHLVSEGEKILNQYKIPSFRFPERAISTIGSMWHWKNRQLASQPQTNPESYSVPDSIKQILSQAAAAHQPSLDNLQADQVISQLGIPTPPTQAVASLDQAKTFTQNVGWPIVLKLSSPALLHKGHVGGVVTDIWNESQLDLAWDRLNHKIPELPPDVTSTLKFQAQKDVTSGVEVIVGLKHDPTFGPVLLFGAGGQLAELVSDKNLKILPVSLDQAKQLVMQSKVYKLLQNHEGEPPYALDKLYDLITKLTQAVPSLPEASDIEINPVIVTHNDVWAVDSKVVLHSPTVRTPAAPKFHTATVLSNTILTSTFHYLEIESEQPITYQPGQYVSIKVTPTRINSYSIAGHTDDRHFSLLVDTSPGGPGSKFFENVKPGDKFAYLGPFGVFTLKPEDGSNRIIFLGTGTGCSPLRSILEAALKNPQLKTDIDFYFGLRYSSDIFWQDYFQKLQSQYPNFHFNLVLSRPDESWHGQVGHITDLLKSQLSQADNCSAYLCGSPAMIEEATNILLSASCPKDRIYTEKF